MADTYLSRTFSGANTSRKTFTLSFWVKRSNLGERAIISASTTSNFYDNIVFVSSDQLDINNVASGSDAISFKTNRVFRDPSAWYHIVIAIDTTQASSSNGIKIYVNGEQETSFASSTYTQDATFEIGRDGSTTSIGRREQNTDYYGIGYLADFYYIDGQQLTPASFGETDSTTGIWKFKTYSGTYGNNGFHLQFKNSAALGTDTSGNSETFTVNNPGTNPQVVDTPTNNFSVMSPVNIFPNTTPIITTGNLKTQSQSTSGAGLCSTMAVSAGKWYAEGKIGSGATLEVGAVDIGTNAFNKGGTSTNSVGYDYGGNIRVNNSNTQTSLSTYTGGDIIGILLNMDTATGTVTFYKNGSAVGSAQNFTTSKPNAAAFYMQSHTSSGNQSVEWNYGNPTFSISSGNADANGFGNFEYAVPSGYYALCTKNINTYG